MNQIIQKGLKGHHRIHAIREKAIAMIDDHIEKGFPGNDPGKLTGNEPVGILQRGHIVLHPPCGVVEPQGGMIDSGS